MEVEKVSYEEANEFRGLIIHAGYTDDSKKKDSLLTRIEQEIASNPKLVYEHSRLSSPVQTAIGTGDIKLADLLLNCGCTIDGALASHIRNTHKYHLESDITEFLLAHGADPNEAVWDAVYCKENLELLLKAGVDATAYRVTGWNLLHQAVNLPYGQEKIDTDAVKLLLDHGANPDQMCQKEKLSEDWTFSGTPIRLAMRMCFEEVVYLMMQKKIEMGGQLRNTPIYRPRPFNA